MSDTLSEYCLIQKQISDLQKSLDGSYQALSQRVARLENRKDPCERKQTVCVTFSRDEARSLYTYLQSQPDWKSYWPQINKLVDAIDLGI